MDTKFFIFSSVTYALRAMTLLKKYGIFSRLEKIKNITSLGGCGYALAIQSDFAENAISIIQNEGIRIVDVLGYK